MLKSCNTVFSDSIEISDCVPPSSDVEQGPEYISIRGINNNTAMIINIKRECYFAPCELLVCFLMYGCSLANRFYCVLSWKILYITKASPRDMIQDGTKQT